MKSISILMAAALYGCHATNGGVVREPVEVKVGVPTPCVEQIPEEPKWALDDPAVKNADLFTRGNVALQEIEQRRAHIKELRATLVACQQQIP